MGNEPKSVLPESRIYERTFSLSRIGMNKVHASVIVLK